MIMLTTDKSSRRFLALTAALFGTAATLTACTLVIPSDPGFPEEPTPVPSDTLTTTPTDGFYAELERTFPLSLTTEGTKESAKALALATCDALDEGVSWDMLYEQAFADSEQYGSIEIAVAGVNNFCPEHVNAITRTTY